MENGIFFSLISLVYNLLLVIVFFSKKRYVSQENNIYRKIIVVNLLGLLIEVFSATYASKYLMAIAPQIAMIVLKFRLIYFIAWTCLFSLYIVSLCVSEQKLERDARMKKTNIALIILGLLFIVGTIIVFILPLYTYRRGNMAYTYGPATTSVYIVGGLQMIAWILLMMKNIKYIVNKKYIPILLFILIGVVITIFEARNPELTLMVPLQTFITFLMYFTIENPDMKMIEELEIARDNANNASKAKTEFLSSVSHEIRNPLNVIIGLGEEIANLKDPREINENAKDIVGASTSLLATVNGILDISKIEKGTVEITNTEYDPNEVLQEIGKLNTYKFTNKNIEYSYSIAKDLPKQLLGDYLTLKRIINGLVEEAYKSTKAGYVHFEVNCINSEDVCKLIISIEDTGHGIKNEELEKIFNKKETADNINIVKEAHLNLISTNQLVDLMGGKIIAQSVYGSGSKYTIIVNQRIKPSDENSKKVNLDLSYLNILLVDDNPLNLKVTAKKLQKLNATSISKVESGFECLDKINQGEQYDLIFLDDMMPKMTGVETLKKLHELPNFKTPVIALTANAIVGMKERYLKAGFDDYLAKPLETEDLIQVLNKILNPTSSEETNSGKPFGQSEIIPVDDDVQKILSMSNNKNYSKEEQQEPESLIAETYDENYLSENGININRALELLEDIEMYNSTLLDFYNKIDNELEKLGTYKNNGDIDNYIVEIHSLKSDCKYLGLTKLGDIAYEHELNAKKKDINYVQEHYKDIVEELNHILPIIEKYLENNKTSS